MKEKIFKIQSQIRKNVDDNDSDQYIDPYAEFNKRGDSEKRKSLAALH